MVSNEIARSRRIAEWQLESTKKEAATNIYYRENAKQTEHTPKHPKDSRWR